jgi:hypothetical protein
MSNFKLIFKYSKDDAAFKDQGGLHAPCPQSRPFLVLRVYAVTDQYVKLLFLSL